MPSPVSPLTTLASALQSAPTLKGFARVLLGAKSLAAAGAPPRIVIFPRTGEYKSATDNVSSLRDISPLKLVARCWGSDFDQAWDLRARFLQALESQANAGGIYWKAYSEEWEETPDTSIQGQELEVIFDGIFSIDRVTFATGEIDEVKLDGGITVP